MELWESISRMIVSLGVVLALMMGLLYVARRVMAGRGMIAASRPLVHVLATGYLGPRKTVSLVSVAGEFLIVGATANDLIPLGRVTDPASIKALVDGKVEVNGQVEADVQAEIRK